MGFIYGIINFDNESVQPNEIEILGKATGWENFICNVFPNKNIALGFCHHPKRKPKSGYYQDNVLMVLADIRIYNSDELRQTFDFQTPEEALAKAYLRWGTECVNYINGDFAALIFDHRSHHAHLLRDHIGARPLTYWCQGEKLIFASHEYGLTQSRLFPVSLSEPKLIDELFRRRDNYEQTVFKKIKKVLPGYCVTFSSNGCNRKTRYWTPENIQKDGTLTFEIAVTRLRELLVEATCTRMEPVKTGMHVSGGIDSCGIASIVADHNPDKCQLTGYSLTPEVFNDPFDGINEKEFIDAWSEEKDIRVKYLNLRQYQTVKDAIIPHFPVQHIEHPIMRMAQRDEIEILFSGWGGDEFISLGTRGTVNHLFFKLKWIQLYRYIRQKGIKWFIGKCRTDIFPQFVPFNLMPIYKAGWTDWSNLKLLRAGFILKYCQKIFLYKKKNVFGYGNRTQFALNLIESFHLPDRMDSWAINAERYGFEYKYPLLDKEVLDFWFSIPVEFTYMDFQPRLLYREAMKGILPEKIRTRNDKGEAVRNAFSFRETQKGRKYLEHLFYSLSNREHLPFFRPGAFHQVFSNYNSCSKLKKIRAIEKSTLYLRYIALVKKYLK